MKVAIVCDWLTGIGGAERIVLELHRMFPEAPIYTSQYDPSALDWFKNADVRTGWLQKFPIRLRKFLPVFRAHYFSHLDLSSYDLIISNNFGAESKAVKFGSNTKHICICNAPTHYYWSRYEQYMENPGWGAFNWLGRLGLRLLVGSMRRWDYKAAQKPTKLVAISTHVQTEIKKYYGRDSTVIFPPVEVGRFANLETKERSGFIITGRQTPYKRIDLAIAACSKLGLPLTVIGDGPEHKKLVQMAGPTVTFVTSASDQEVANYLAAARGFIFPNLDDFGIAAVEAMAAGTPVIAYKAGGALDYIVEGKTGQFFTNQSVESLADCLKSFQTSHYIAADIQAAAQTFSTDTFVADLRKFLE